MFPLKCHQVVSETMNGVLNGKVYLGVLEGGNDALGVNQNVLQCNWYRALSFVFYQALL